MKNPVFNHSSAVAELRAINLPGWGGNYVPAILAKKARGEGPSRVSRNECSWLQRSLHMLSKAEQGVARLALYHPALFELREQVPFSCGPASHPMAGHPHWIGKEWPCTQGTIQIANALGGLEHHPRTWVEATGAPDDATGGRWEPNEWVGDILLFLLDHEGPYCVHWDVKAVRGEHGRPSFVRRSVKPTPRSEGKASARSKVQLEYFRQLGIRHVEVARADLNDSVVCNLQQLSYWDSRAVEMGAREEEQLVIDFLRALAGGVPPIDVMREAERKRELDLEDCRRVFHRAIWRRVLRVDLFSPVLVDRPMRPERLDVLDVYAHLFKRS